MAVSNRNVNPKTTLTVATVLLVASAFAGAAVNPALGAPTGAGDAPTALQDEGDGEGQDGGDGGERVTGENATIQNLNLTNVTLQNVYVNQLVANVTEDAGEQREVRMENVTVAAVTVQNATVENATFDTLGMHPELATDILGQVGDGINPEGDLPSIPIEGRNISDRTVTGVEFGRLEVETASVENVTVEGESGEIEQEVSDPVLSGQGVNVTSAEAQDLTIVGLESGDEADAPRGQSDGGENNETES